MELGTSSPIAGDLAQSLVTLPMRHAGTGALQTGPRGAQMNDHIPAHRGLMRSRSRAACGERRRGVLVVLVLSVPAHGRRLQPVTRAESRRVHAKIQQCQKEAEQACSSPSFRYRDVFCHGEERMRVFVSSWHPRGTCPIGLMVKRLPPLISAPV